MLGSVSVIFAVSNNLQRAVNDATDYMLKTGCDRRRVQVHNRAQG